MSLGNVLVELKLDVFLVPTEEEVHHDAHAPNVTLTAVSQIFKDFRGHVHGSAGDILHHRAGISECCESKVGHFDVELV